MQTKDRRITGHLIVEQRASGRAYVAKYMTAAGRPTRKVLGPAWVKDSGRRTARGAVIWRAADGQCPDGHLTPKLAQDVLDALIGAERGKPRTQVRHYGRTLGDAVAEWLRHREQEKGLAETTLRDYRATVKRDLYPVLAEDLPLRRITTARVEQLQTHLLQTKRSPRTAQKTMVLLFGILALARRRGWIGENPCERLDRIRTTRRSDLGHVLTPEQVYAVARAVRAGDREDREQAAAAIVVAAFTGLRVGELRALRWEDVDFADGVVRVRRNLPSRAEREKAPKSGAGRIVPLIPQAAKELDRLSRRATFTGPDDRVFGRKAGAAVEENAMRNAFYAGLQTAGMGRLRAAREEGTVGPPPIRFHDLRHTFGTLAAQAFPLRDVQAYMGHAQITTTEIYLHHVPQHDAGAKLGNLIAAKLEPLVAPAAEGSLAAGLDG